MSFKKQVIGFGLYDGADKEHGVAIVKGQKANWYMLAHYPTLGGKPVGTIATAAKYFATEEARKVAIDKFVADAKAKAIKTVH